MAKVMFEPEVSLPDPRRDLRVFATVNGDELVRCRIAKEVFGDCLGIPEPTKTDVSSLRSGIECAFGRMIDCNDSIGWIDGNVSRKEFLLTSENFTRYYPTKVGL
jgi:hypothetical protein